MSLKNCKIGILIEDRAARAALSRLLWQNGAIVYCADSDEELQTFEEIIGFDWAIVSVEPQPEWFSLN